VIPVELLERDQWVVWRLEQRNGKPTKVPYSAIRRGARAAANDPATWSNFVAVRKAAEGMNGVGYVFAPDDPFCGVDVDGCRGPDGSLDPRAQAIVERLASYTEVSQSGRGVHVLVRARKPGERSRVGSVELYDRGRFFAVTGEHLIGTPSTIEQRQDELEVLYRELFPESVTNSKAAHNADPWGDVRAGSCLVDEEVLERMFSSRAGGKIRRLWAGDWSGHASQSEADAALCAHLAYWASCDPVRMDELFRQSALYREKWDRELHGGGEATYGRRTIEYAIGLVGGLHA